MREKKKNHALIPENPLSDTTQPFLAKPQRHLPAWPLLTSISSAPRLEASVGKMGFGSACSFALLPVSLSLPPLALCGCLVPPPPCWCSGGARGWGSRGKRGLLPGGQGPAAGFPAATPALSRASSHLPVPQHRAGNHPQPTPCSAPLPPPPAPGRCAPGSGSEGLLAESGYAHGHGCLKTS